MTALLNPGQSWEKVPREQEVAHPRWDVPCAPRACGPGGLVDVGLNSLAWWD